MKRSILALAVLILLGFSGASIAADGKVTYNMKCAGCHGSSGQGSTMAPALSGTDLINGDAEAIKGVITAGVSGGDKKYANFPLTMPKFTFNDADLEALVAYMKNF